MESINFAASRSANGGAVQGVDPLKRVVGRIGRTKDFPTISKYIVEINQKLSDHSIHSSASELANVILKDYALTNKLLKLVNSAFYGFVAGKVTTVTRAVVLLGNDRVRLAAISLVLFEHFKRKSVVRDLKEATIRSFWCGLMAKEVAQMQAKVDPEEAFICGLLHQLGRLLIIYHLPHEYRQIKKRMIEGAEDETKAVKQVLGITYRALGLAIGRQWYFPQRIVATMASVSVKDLGDKSKRVEPLCALTNFIDDLAHVIETTTCKRRGAAIETILEHYQNYIFISYKQTKAAMETCLDHLWQHADALQISMTESDFLMRLVGKTAPTEAATDDRSKNPSPEPPIDSEAAFRFVGDSDLSVSATTLEGADSVSIIMGGIQEISTTMMGAHDINDIALMSLEIIYRALQCQSALLFIHEGRNKLMEARYGYGDGIQRLVGNLTFQFDGSNQSDLFSKALQNGKDLIVDDAQAPDFQNLIPTWYSQTIDAKAFIFMPIAYQNVCLGAYYGDFAFSGQTVNDLEHKYLSMLRNQLILAIKMER